MMGAAQQAEAKRRKVFDAARVTLKSSLGPDGHRHCVTFDGDGAGLTSVAPDGHFHEVRDLEILAARDGHRHELGEVRCLADHNARGNHVIRRGRR